MDSDELARRKLADLLNRQLENTPDLFKDSVLDHLSRGIAEDVYRELVNRDGSGERPEIAKLALEGELDLYLHELTENPPDPDAPALF